MLQVHVTDAMLQVHVTKSDIQGSKRTSLENPISRAIERQYGISYTTVGQDILTVSGIWYLTTKSSRRFIRAFNTKPKKYLKPSTFRFRKPKRIWVTDDD